MALIRQLREEVYMPDVVFPDPTKPETMIDPIAVALRIPSDSDFIANYYPNSSKTVLIGLVVNSKNIDNALAFLNYTMQ